MPGKCLTVLVYRYIPVRRTWRAAFDTEQAMTGKTNHTIAWKVDRNHVYPINDLREHSLIGCWCGATDDDGVMVHNSLDRREMYERGERKPS